MATHSGDEGIIKIGTAVVAEIRSWSLTESVDMREDTAMGEVDRTYVAGKQTWSVSIDAWWDETDTLGQEAMTKGATVALNLFPEGDASTDQTFSGSAIIEEITKSADQEGMVEASFTGRGNGALTKGAVS